MPHGKPGADAFGEHTDHLVETFTSSLAFDRRLYSQDVQGSIAHAQTLNRAGVLTMREVGPPLSRVEPSPARIGCGSLSLSAA